MPRIATALAAVAAGCCMAGAAAGCSSSSPPTHEPATPAPPATARSTQSPGDPHAQILAAYTSMWRAFAAAARTADYQPGPLEQYAEGNALTLLTHGLYVNHQHGVVIHGAPVLDPKVTGLIPPGNPSKATVTDCADDRHWLEYSTSGRPVAGASTGHRRIYAWLQLFGSTWKVTYVVVEKAGTCDLPEHGDRPPS
jgi:hypothetical protein